MVQRYQAHAPEPLGSDSNPPVSQREEAEDDGEHREASRRSRVDQSGTTLTLVWGRR